MSRYATLTLATLVGTALSAATVVQANACDASVPADIGEITDVKVVQSIEKRVLPSGPVVSRAVSSPAPITTGRDAAVPKFGWPVRGNLVVPICSNPPDWGRAGINIAAPEGTVVKAAADGVVTYAGDELKGYGKLVLISHSNGWVTAYAFNSKLLVKRRDQVRQGQSVALVGHDLDTFPQLHFEIRRGSQSLNPLDYLPN
jgi:murein DD-endopeptidase MepM/ murein hydrolase activator NlpD